MHKSPAGRFNINEKFVTQPLDSELSGGNEASEAPLDCIRHSELPNGVRRS